jgi:hypothetical protein
MNTVIPCYWFDTTGNPDAVQKVRERDSDPGMGRKIRCRICGHVVTDEKQRISIENGHSHQRVNPSGIEYHFQCFREAPGCGALGQATLEHTWFAGFRWQIAVCSGCGEHLGWYFRGTESFYGLIAAKLIYETGGE